MTLSGFLGVAQMAKASTGSTLGTTSSLDTLDNADSTSTPAPVNIPGSLVLTTNVVTANTAFIGFSLGDASTFAILDEGTGSGSLNLTNDTVKGNIGIGDPSGKTTTTLNVSKSTVQGSIDFAGAIKDSISGSTVTGSINANDAQVTTDLTYLNNLSTTLGKEAGTSVSVPSNATGTLNANTGKLDSSGNYVFSITSWGATNGTFTINGDNLGHNVVINFTAAGCTPNFSNISLNLTGGLTADNVLFNITNSATLTMGSVSGTFLDPNGFVTASNDTITGHLYVGGTANSTLSNDTISCSQ